MLGEDVLILLVFAVEPAGPILFDAAVMRGNREGVIGEAAGNLRRSA